MTAYSLKTASKGCLTAVTLTITMAGDVHDKSAYRRRKMDEREATGDEIHLVLTRRRGRRQPYYIEGSMLYRMGPAPQCFSCFPCSVHSQRYWGPSQISIFFPMRSQQRAPASRRHMERKHVRSYGQRVRNHFIV